MNALLQRIELRHVTLLCLHGEPSIVTSQGNVTGHLLMYKVVHTSPFNVLIVHDCFPTSEVLFSCFYQKCFHSKIIRRLKANLILNMIKLTFS